MNFLKLAKERYSYRKISNKKVEKEKIDKIIEAANAVFSRSNDGDAWAYGGTEKLEQYTKKIEKERYVQDINGEWVKLPFPHAYTAGKTNTETNSIQIINPHNNTAIELPLETALALLEFREIKIDL